MLRKVWKFRSLLLIPAYVLALLMCIFAKDFMEARAERAAKQRQEYERTSFRNPIEQFERNHQGQPICPHCGRDDQIRIYAYGLYRDHFPEGKVPGGCGYSKDSPGYLCSRCGTSFGKTSQFDQ